MTPDDLAAIRARAEAATEGPWEVRASGMDALTRWEAGVHSLAMDPGEEDTTIAETLDTADAEFIAHARTDVPALLAEIDRLRDMNERLRAQHAAADEVIRAVLRALKRGPDTDPVLEAGRIVAERDALAAEAKRSREEVESYRAAICFETTCTSCAHMLNTAAGLEAEVERLAEAVAAWEKAGDWAQAKIDRQAAKIERLTTEETYWRNTANAALKGLNRAHRREDKANAERDALAAENERVRAQRRDATEQAEQAQQEADALAAKIERVETLADEYQRGRGGPTAKRILAALADPKEES